MPVDSFKFLPRLIATFYQMTERKPQYPIPWTPITRPLSESKFGLITSGGLYHKGVEPAFDLEREVKEPTWGDPSFRTIPSDIRPDELGVSHLHINPEWAQKDFNVLLPLQRFQELTVEREIGGLADQAYSFMGYQGFPPDTRAWVETYAPQVIENLKAERVDCILLTPS